MHKVTEEDTMEHQINLAKLRVLLPASYIVAMNHTPGCKESSWKQQPLKALDSLSTPVIPRY